MGIETIGQPSYEDCLQPRPVSYDTGCYHGGDGYDGDGYYAVVARAKRSGIPNYEASLRFTKTKSAIVTIAAAATTTMAVITMVITVMPSSVTRCSEKPEDTNLDSTATRASVTNSTTEATPTPMALVDRGWNFKGRPVRYCYWCDDR